MSSAFKNFFITFAICLIIFAILGVQVGKWLSGLVTDIIDGGGSEVSEEAPSESEVSEDPNEDISTVDPDDYNEDGKIFTAVVLCVDDDNRVVNCVFIDSNEKTDRYIYCKMPVDTRISNEVGNAVPISDMLGFMTPEEVCQCITAMTGIETEFCLRFDKNDMEAIASKIPGASVILGSPITLPIPEYALPTTPENSTGDSWMGEEEAPTESTEPAEPIETTFVIDNDEAGRVLLNDRIYEKTNLYWLLESEKNAIGISKNKLYDAISESLMLQFVQNKADAKAMLYEFIGFADTNLTKADIDNYHQTIANSKFKEFTFKGWDHPSTSELRKYDGRYDG